MPLPRFWARSRFHHGRFASRSRASFVMRFLRRFSNKTILLAILVVLLIILIRLIRPKPWLPQELCENKFPLLLWRPKPTNIWIPPNGDLSDIPAHRPRVPPRAEWRPKYCIIARTYAAQTPEKNVFSVDKFIASIQMQTDPNWFLVLLDTDSRKPFPYLHRTVARWVAENDPFRVQVAKSNPFYDNPDTSWSDYFLSPYEQLHKNVYWYTDHAIHRKCPANSEYLIATNADNWYDPHFLEKSEQTLLRQRADFVGADFTSRHALWVWDISKDNYTCQIFQRFDPTVCNALVPARTDLGAMMFNLTRWRQDDISFGKIINMCELPPSMSDGCVALHLRREFGWRGARVPQTLFSHAPNPWLCLVFGGNVVLKPNTDPDEFPEYECVTSDEDIPEEIDGDAVSMVELSGGACFQPQDRSNRPDPFEEIPYIYNSSGRFFNPSMSEKAATSSSSEADDEFESEDYRRNKKL